MDNRGRKDKSIEQKAFSHEMQVLNMDVDVKTDQESDNERERHDDDQTSVNWKVFGHLVPRSEVVYICQMIIIFIVIISCIINLALNNGNSEMWVSFFGYAFGAMLPQPRIKYPNPSKSFLHSNNNLLR